MRELKNVGYSTFSLTVEFNILGIGSATDVRGVNSF